MFLIIRSVNIWNLCTKFVHILQEGRPCELLQADKYRHHFVGFSVSLVVWLVAARWVNVRVAGN